MLGQYSPAYMQIDIINNFGTHVNNQYYRPTNPYSVFQLHRITTGNKFGPWKELRLLSGVGILAVLLFSEQSRPSASPAQSSVAIAPRAASVDSAKVQAPFFHDTDLTAYVNLQAIELSRPIHAVNSVLFSDKVSAAYNWAQAGAGRFMLLNHHEPNWWGHDDRLGRRSPSQEASEGSFSPIAEVGRWRVDQRPPLPILANYPPPTDKAEPAEIARPPEPRDFVGIWAPAKSACSPRHNRGRLLPAVIGADGAWAGEASCAFRSLKKVGRVWRATATCSDARDRWKANVRLAVAGDRLTWASERGTQGYFRCPRYPGVANTAASPRP